MLIRRWSAICLWKKILQKLNSAPALKFLVAFPSPKIATKSSTLLSQSGFCTAVYCEPKRESKTRHKSWKAVGAWSTMNKWVTSSRWLTGQSPLKKLSRRWTEDESEGMQVTQQHSPPNYFTGRGILLYLMKKDFHFFTVANYSFFIILELAVNQWCEDI